jgi:uncharacterized protein (UPF0333 family)
MKSATRVFIRVREFAIGRIRGQTLMEYSLVLLAVAVASIGAYIVLGNNLNSLTRGADSSLTNG